MTEPIHHWSYIQDRKFSSKIELFHDHILQHQSGATPKAIRYSFEEFFLMDTILGNPIVDFELMQYVVTISVVEEFSPEAQSVYHFYKNFDHKGIVEESYEEQSNLNTALRYFKTINRYGLEQYYEDELGIYIQSRQRFYQFFFQGPLMSKIPLDLRQSWKRSVWAALGEPRIAELRDGFPLFDYTKITEKRYVFEVEGTEKVDYLELYPNHILIGKIDGEENISQKYSIEQIWYDERLIPEVFSGNLKEIHHNLISAIIEGNRNRRFRRLSAIASTNNAELPGEAPPA